MNVKLKHRQKTSVKELLKIASKIAPQSVVSLKRSLSLNQTNLDSFIQCVHEYSNQKDEEKKLRQLSWQKYNTNMAIGDREEEKKRPSRRQIILRKQMITKNTLRQEFKLNKNQLKIDPAQHFRSYRNQANSDFASKTCREKRLSSVSASNYTFTSNTRPIINRQLHSRRTTSIIDQNRLNTQQSNRSYTQYIDRPPSTPGSTAHRFWKKKDISVDSRPIRMKTQVLAKKQDSTLRELTSFSPQINRRAINQLVLQLQINLDCDRHNKVIPHH